MDPSSAAPGPATLLLPATTPAQWRAVHAQARVAGRDGSTPGGAWVTTDELLAGGALRAVHTRLCEGGAPPAAVAKWVVSWFAGGLADAVGFMFATAAAAPLVERERARWRLHPGGWPDRVDAGDVPVAVSAGHPWAGLPGTVAVADEDAVATRAVAALAAAVDPLVEAGRRLAKVGRRALWAEVADGLGLPVLHQLDVPGDRGAVRRLRLLLDAPAAPWRTRAELRLADTADGPVYVGRKGGCCLAYRCPPGPEPEPSDERQRAYRERFPLRPEEPRYCSTCVLRDLADCEDRQLFWLQQERAARAAVP